MSAPSLPAARDAAASPVLRPRLLEHIAQPSIAPITLIVAPAGYGKSTLAAQVAEAQPLPVAWLALTPSHNTPSRFLRDLCVALAPWRANEPAGLDDVLAALRDRADREPGSLIVLDDLHLIESREALDLVDSLLLDLPAGLHLVLLSRTAPNVSLARHRIAGRVRELHAGDLGFTLDELRELVDRTSTVPVPEHALAELVARSEGWIAGIHLALASLQADASSGNESVFDAWQIQDRLDEYVVEDVLAHLPDELRAFVLKTAILPHLDPELCDAVLGTATSAALVAEASRQLHFVRPIEPAATTLRYHALFAESAARIGDRLFPASDRRERHLRAAGWFADHGQLEPALSHAIQAEAWDLAREYARAVGRDLMDRDQSASRLFWLRQIPEDHLLGDPELARFYLSALQYVGEYREVRRLLPVVEELWGRSPDPAHRGHLASTHAFLALLDGRVDDWLAAEYQALHLYPLTNVVDRFHAWVGLMEAEFHRGNHDLAAEAYRQARACREQLPAEQRWSVIPDYDRANHLALQGDLPAAIAFFRTLLAELPVWARGHVPRYHASLAALHLERNELEAAAAEIAHVEQGLSDHPHVVWWPELLLVIARVSAACGRPGLPALRRAQEMQIQRGGSGLLRRIDAVRASLWLDEGQTSLAAAWAASARLDGPWRQAQFFDPDPRAVVARALVAAGQPAEARDYLDPHITEARDAGRWAELVRLLVWQMAAQLATGSQRAAVAALREALRHGRPGGFVRAFLPEGVDVRPFYRSVQRRLPAAEAAYLGRLLEIADGAASAAGPDAGELDPPSLSDRELEVLRLVADGCANRDIAQQLFITERTVKKHVGAILAKLGAPNRTAAIIRARQLGLDLS